MADNNDVDLVITEADLDEFERVAQSAQEFFADPEPKPVAPTALIEAKCAQTHRGCYYVFEQTAENAWAVRGYLDKLPGAATSATSTAQVQRNLVSGRIDWSDLSAQKRHCPHCSASSLIKCGACKRVSCHSGGGTGSPSTCAWCGRTAKIGGRITSMDGTRDKKGKH